MTKTPDSPTTARPITTFGAMLLVGSLVLGLNIAWAASDDTAMPPSKAAGSAEPR